MSVYFAFNFNDIKLGQPAFIAVIYLRYQPIYPHALSLIGNAHAHTYNIYGAVIVH